MKGEYTSAAEGGKRRRREDMKDIVRREKLKSRIRHTGEIQMLTAVGRTGV